MNPLVSIIIPTYKPAGYLKECLASIKSQTLPSSSFEVLLILNGDRHPFEEFISDSLSEAGLANVSKLLYCKDKGVSYARNYGIEHSSGEYITFVDDDDIISPDYLENLLSISSETCIGCSNCRSFVSSVSENKENFLSKHYSDCKGKQYSQYLFRGFLSPPFAKMIHRSLIGDVRFQTNLAYSEDSVFCFGICPKIKDMKIAEDSCCYYLRARAGSATHKPFSFKRDVSQFFLMEWSYLAVYLKQPFAYETRFVASRFAAAFRNLWRYYKRNASSKRELIRINGGG